MEFMLFLATLASVPPVVRWLLGGRRVPLAWAALFLFPGIFVYDSTLSLGADHVLAFWAGPVLLAARRAFVRLDRRDAALFGTMAAGAALTKYQAIFLLAGPAIALAARGVAMAARERAVRRALLGSGVALLVFVGVTSIHWLKNTVWYGDPLYPLLHGWFGGRPWNPLVDLAATMQPAGWSPTGTFPSRVLQTVRGVASFAFVPHDWPNFHGDWPVLSVVASRPLFGPAPVAPRMSDNTSVTLAVIGVR